MSSRFYGIFSPRINKNRRFNYVPRFYDEDMDDLRNRIKAAESKEKNEYDVKGFRDRIRSGYERRENAYNTHHNKAIWASRIRLVLIIGILSVITWQLMTHDLLTFIFEAFDV